MKKITSLQILMIMGLSLSASSTFCSSDDIDMQEAVAFELQSAQTEQARLEVLTDLAESYPEQVEHLILNESDLESNFDSIRNFVNKKNKDIEELLQQKVVSEAEVARLAVELADAQSMLENTIAKHRAKNKRKPKKQQAIKDALMKAEQGLRLLSQRAVSGLNNFGKAVVKNGKKANKAVSKKLKKKLKKSKNNAPVEEVMISINQPMNLDEMNHDVVIADYDDELDSADEAIAMMNAQLLDDEVVVQSVEGQELSTDVQAPEKSHKGSKKGPKKGPKNGSKKGSKKGSKRGPRNEENQLTSEDAALLDESLLNDEVVVQSRGGGHKKGARHHRN